MKVSVARVLFCKLNDSNTQVLHGLFKGQHHLVLGTNSDLGSFGEGVAETSTSLGGWERTLSIEPFEGKGAVPALDLTYRYMGPASQRKDYYFASQTAHTYPLWKPARARPGATSPADFVGDLVLVIEDIEGRFHARYVRKEEITTLPADLEKAVARAKTGKGVYTVPDAGTGPSPRVAEVIAALRRHHNVLLYGPPGTGKTHLVTEVRRHFGGEGLILETESEENALQDGAGLSPHGAWATFHQSYSYEDFLVGLRPRPLDGGGFELVPHPGILLELSEWARQPGRESLLVIDEINRGNVSRIFGEFITLMEADKRLSDDGVLTERTVEVRLPFIDGGVKVEVELPGGTSATVPVPFTMPHRVYTLATMNSVDKSVAPLDAALRRRFHVVSLFPQPDHLRERLGLDATTLSLELVPAQPQSRDEVCWTALALLDALNTSITLFLGPDFQFGEWLMAPLIDTSNGEEAGAALAEIWRAKLMPQLEDYFVGRSEQLEMTLGDPNDDEPALIVDRPSPAFVEAGAVRAIRGNPAAEDGQVLRFVASVGRRGLEDSKVS